MTDKELRKLRRDDLLQILIAQQKQIDELSATLEERDKALEDRRIAIQESGSIAEAALRLNGVFEKAQAAASQYLDQVRADADAQRRESDEQAAEAREMADEVVRKARAEANRIIAEARDEAQRIAGEARGDAQRTAAPAPVSDEADSSAEDKRRGLFSRKGR